MSLNWNTADIENNEEVCFEEREATPTQRGGRYLKPLTESFVFGCMSIGIGQWTADNADEVFARLKIIEKLDGSFVRTFNDETKEWENYSITPEDVQRHIGLHVNVSFESRKEWAQRIFVGDGDGLIKYGTKKKPLTENDNGWDSKPDVSQTTSLARFYRQQTKKHEVEA